MRSNGTRLGTVGTLYLEEGRTELAQAFFAEAVGRCQQVGEARLKGFFLGKQAQALAERGDLEEARARLDLALVVLHEVGDLRHEGLFLAFSGYLQAQEGKSGASWLDARFDRTRKARSSAMISSIS